MANLVDYAINSIPISGRYLAHNHLDRVHRAFLAADLHSGARQLVQPTTTQAALLANVNRTYTHWAIKRQAERAQIEGGFVPLVPARANGEGHYGSLTATITDDELIGIAIAVGPDRMLLATAAAESDRIAS